MEATPKRSSLEDALSRDGGNENTKMRHFDDDDDDDDDVNDGILLRHVTRLYRSNLALL